MDLTHQTRPRPALCVDARRYHNAGRPHRRVRDPHRRYIKVAGVDFGKAGAKTFVASVASGKPRSMIELRLARVDGPVIGTLQVGETGAPGQWQEKSVGVSAPAGAHDLFIVFKGGWEQSMFDFDHWRFER